MEPEEIKSVGRGRKRKKRDTPDVKIDRPERNSKTRKKVVETKPRALVGRYVRKDFEGYGIFLGKVVSYSIGLYRVDYEDGDSEDLESSEVSEILVEERNFDSKMIASRKKLDQLIFSRNSKKPSKRSASKVVEPANDAHGTGTTPISKMSLDDECGSKSDVEPVVLENPILDADDDSSSDSCESLHDSYSKNDAPAIPPPPTLPPSSGNINVPEESVSYLFSVYQFLRSFSTQLYLSPFQLDDLVGSLNYAGPNSLLDAIHYSLMRALRRHLEMVSSDGVELASKCLRRLDWNLLDTFTWPVYVVEYLLVMGYAKGSEWKGFYNDVLDNDYYSLSVSRKLMILQILCDDVIESAELRAEIDMRENSEVGTDSDGTANLPSANGLRSVHPKFVKTSAWKDPGSMQIVTNSQDLKPSQHGSFSVCGSTKIDKDVADVDEDGNSDECKLCGMDGTLLCCDGCPAVYHSRCIGVSKMLLPEGDWFCPECTANKESSLRIGTGLKGAEFFGVDPYGQVYLGSCNHLLVLKSSVGEILASRYYNQNDIPKVLRAVFSSVQYRILFSGICRGILDYWGIPEEKNLSLLDRTEGMTNLAEGKENVLALVPSSASAKDTDKLIDSGRDICPSSVVENNVEDALMLSPENHDAGGVNGTLLGTANEAAIPGLDTDGATSQQFCPSADTKIPEQFGTESTMSSGSIIIRADLSNSAHQSSKDAGDMFLPVKSDTLNLSSESIVGSCSARGITEGETNGDCSYMGALFKPQSYVNQYSLGDVAASSAANLAVLSSEEHRISGTQASSNNKKIVSENVSVQVKAFSSATIRFLWPNSERKVTEVPRERCGWCLSCKSSATCKKGCLLNLAALHAVKGPLRNLGALRPVMSGEGNLPGIASYIFYMEERLRGLVVGPFLTPNYRKQWRKRVQQASTCDALKPLLLELEENIRLVVFSKGWVKLVDDWFVESSINQGGTISNGPTPKRSGGRRRKQSVASETVTEPCDDDSKNFIWWRGGKLLKLVFQKGILPCPVATKAARQGGSKKITGVYYAEGSEIPKRSRRFAWRAAVEMSKNAAQLALQVRYLDLHVRWSDLTRPENNSLDSKGVETVNAVFRNARISDKKMKDEKISYGLSFGEQKHLPSRVLKSILEVEENPDGKDKYWFSETQIPLYLIKQFEEKAEVPLPLTKIDSPILSNLQRKQLKVSRKDVFSYLVHKRDKVDKCFCASCNEEVLLRDAVKCDACQGYCHKNCTKSSAIDPKGDIDVKFTCKTCFCARAFALNESIKKQAISKICWQGQEKKKAVVVHESVSKNNNHQPLASNRNNDTTMVKKLASTGTKSAKKRKKPAVPTFGVVWKKKNSDETGADFRLSNILLRGNAYPDPSRMPICYICSKPYDSNLMYIRCESCNAWYHADALELKESQIFDVVGFRCCRCRRQKSPLCPHMDPKDIKPKKTRASKQLATVLETTQGMSPLSETISEEHEVMETTPTVWNTMFEDMIIEEDDPLLFSLERVEPIVDSEPEVEPHWHASETLSQGPQKLQVRRQAKCENETDVTSMGGFHSESIPLENNELVGSERELPEVAWDGPMEDFKDEMLDFEGFNFEDMDFEPQTYFSFTELLETDDNQLNPSDASANISGNLGNTTNGGMMPQGDYSEQYENGLVQDHQEVGAQVEPVNVMTVPCQMCSHTDPAPDLFCEICLMQIHNHCSPWDEEVSGEGNWRCGNCREWR